MIPRRPMLLWPWSAAWITALLLASTAAAGIAAEPAGPKTPARLEESPQRKQMADGLPPLEAAEAMSAPAGFSVKLLAAEPDVRRVDDHLFIKKIVHYIFINSYLNLRFGKVLFILNNILFFLFQ